MSETLTPSPYEPGSIEDQQFRQAMLRGAGLAATNLLPGAVAQVIPYREDAQGEGHFQFPLTGALTALYGGTSDLGRMGINYLAGKLGLSGRLQGELLPGGDTASRIYQETKDTANKYVPHMEPQGQGEQVIADMSQSAGGMALPGAGLISGLPRAAQTAVHMAIPTMTVTGTAPILGAALTGGAEVLQEKKQDDLIREMGFDPAKLRLGEETTQDNTHPLVQPDTSTVVAHPAQGGASSTVPFGISSAQAAETTPTPGKTQQVDLGDFGRPDIKLNVPLYGTEGETNMPWWEAAAIAGGVLAGGHVVLKYGGKVLDPAYKILTGQGSQLDTAANAAAHNAQLDAVNQGVVASGATPNASAAVRGEAPLPGKAGTIGTKISTRLFDDTRMQQELAKATAPDKLTGERLAADIGTTNGGSALFNRLTEQMATGVNDATGHNITRLKDMVQKAGQLTEAQQKVLDDGLYAMDELNSRLMKQAQNAASGQSIADTAIRHNLFSQDSAQLRATRDAMLNDPETAAVAQLYHQIGRDGVLEGVAQGRITAQEAQTILRLRPHYVPTTDIQGNVVHTLGERDMTVPGFQTPPTRAVDAMIQHYGKLYEEYAKNTVNDKLFAQLEQWQAANPNRARIIERMPDFTPGRTITVYREGIPHTFAVDRSDLWYAMTGGQSRANIYFNTASALRRSMQAGTTGVLGTVLGQRPYSVINLLRNIPQIATDRFPGTSFGMIDAAMQRATGGRVGSRLGVDPSQYIGSFDQAIRGSAAMTARNLGDMLRTPANPLSKTLRALKGDTWTDALADRMRTRYENSLAAERRSLGIGGSGSGGVYDRPTFNINVSNRAAFNPLAETVPEMFHQGGAQIPFTRIKIPGTHGLVANYINIRTLLRDIHQEISDGANSYYYKQLRANPNLSDAQRAQMTRTVLGDPSITGASPLVQHLGRSVPYFNPSVQDAVRMMRNLRDNPVAFVLGTVGTLGTAAAASTLTAMLGGARHLDMLSQLMSTHDRASNVTLFHDPTNEHNYTQISLPQRWRMLYPMVLEMLSYGLGAYQLREGEDAYHRVIHSLADMFSQHVSQGTVSGVIHGVSDFGDIVQAPQDVQTMLGIAGVKSNPPIGKMLENYNEGKPILGGLVSDISTPTRLPGQQVTNSYISKNDNGWAQTLVSNLLGVAGHALYDAVMHGYQRFSVNHDVADAMTGLTGDAGQSWRDNAPFGNAVWGNNIKLSNRNPMGEQVELALEKMKNMPSAKDIQLQNMGLTRPGGVAVMQQGSPNVNSDPRMTQMLVAINNNYGRISKTLLPQLQDLKKQIETIDNDKTYDAATQRSLHNQHAAQLNDMYAKIDNEIKLLNATLSWMGGKHVDVRSFDPQKGMEQFHD